MNLPKKTSLEWSFLGSCVEPQLPFKLSNACFLLIACSKVSTMPRKKRFDSKKFNQRMKRKKQVYLFRAFWEFAQSADCAAHP